MNEMREKFVINNFDLIRLIAAFEVALIHSIHHLEIDFSGDYLINILRLFPGVPIFFFVSGFLISKSYESNSFLREYAQNRIFRIYPALFICTFLAVCSVYFSGYFNSADVSAGNVFVWIVSQVSFVQFYNPSFMREFGTGVLNGSLWTISVELQFYILVPILYWLLSHFKKSRVNVVLMTLICIFLIFNVVYYKLKGTYAENIFLKLYGVSFLPWFYMFLIGVFFQKNFDWMHKLLRGRFFIIFIVYISVVYVTVKYFGFGLGNGINPVLYILLVMLVFSFAYSFSSLSNKLLRRNDISYGVYIYHIPVINLFIYFGYISNSMSVLLVLILTLILASMSWFYVEKPSLKLKKHPLNPLKY